jgi:hypothetical protein
MAAQAYAPYCDPATLRTVRADRRFLPPPLPTCSDWRKLADPYGCTLAEMSGVSFGRYLDRRADLAQAIALLRTVVWLRAAADTPAEVASVLAARPPELGLVREPAYDAEKDRISIPLHDASRDARFEVAAGAEPRPTRSRTRTSRRSRAVAALE